MLILLDRPTHLNATDAALHTALAHVWDDIAVDEDTRALVVAGRGEASCAGGDVDLIEEQVANFDVVVRMTDEARAIVTGVLECPKPVVAAVHGAAFGAGSALALLADISIVRSRLSALR